MKAIAVVPGTTKFYLTDVEEPQIIQPDQIKMRVVQMGICGTDREIVAGGRARAPEGSDQLILGHEMFGRVTETGNLVDDVQPGDFGLFTVRRGCNECVACLHNRSDMCYTGKYTERGINGADGFQAEYVVDQRQYFVKTPDAIRNIGVLTEPMSVAEKAIDEATMVQQARLKDFDQNENWLKGKQALIAGLGPIGLMAAFALRLRGANVIGMDIVDESELRVRIFKNIGGIYVDGRQTDVLDIDNVHGGSDFVFEATGIAKLQIQLIDTLAINGVYVATGIPAGSRPMTILAGDIMQQMVLKNQMLIGSVNAAVGHYKMAVDDLTTCKTRWPEDITDTITDQFSVADFRKALRKPGENEIKTVINW